MQERGYPGRQWRYALIALAAIFLGFSLRPSYQLRSQPPDNFVKGVPGVSASDNRALASAYWAKARVLRWKYTYGELLPDRPREFTVPEESALSAAQVELTRGAYWQRLQQNWLVPECWTRSFTLNFGWVSSAILRLSDDLMDLANDVRDRLRR